MESTRVHDQQILHDIRALIDAVGGDSTSFEGSLATQMMQTVLRLLTEEHDTGQLKLVNSALKEMRYAYQVFNRYKDSRKISIFGSARTKEDHPDYAAARGFSAGMADTGWMCITGAGDGIMKAGHEGPDREASFGLSIRLPFETTANTVIEGDPKLINFRYFFTRKLMFLSHSDAVAVFPGGFGTQDELFEVLTLVQTGKSNIIPIVLIEGEGGVYWRHWLTYVRKSLLESGWIGEEDTGLLYQATSIEDALDHVSRFYRVYHSSRYVDDQFIMRLHQTPSAEQVEQLNTQFHDLLQSGEFYTCGPQGDENDHLELPRLAFHHNRRRIGRVRALIDCINGFAAPDSNADDSP